MRNIVLCRLKTLILNDNKLTSITFDQKESGFKDQEQKEGKTTCLCLPDYVLHMCT